VREPAEDAVEVGRDAAVAACASRVTLLGVHLVTVEGSRLVPGRWPLPAAGGPLADAS